VPVPQGEIQKALAEKKKKLAAQPDTAPSAVVKEGRVNPKPPDTSAALPELGPTGALAATARDTKKDIINASSTAAPEQTGTPEIQQIAKAAKYDSERKDETNAGSEAGPEETGTEPTPVSAPSDAIGPMAPPEIQTVSPLQGEVKQIKAVDAPGKVPEKPAEYAPPGEGVGRAPPVEEKMQEAAAAIQEDPKIGEKILKMAADTGIGILELIQGFAYGMARSDRPLASEVRQREKEQKTALDAQAAAVQAEQDFQMNLARIQDTWQNARFSASTKAERDAADTQRAFLEKQNALDRQNALAVAGERAKAVGAGGQADRQAELAKIIQSIFEKGK
jgi:hypothetical protein